MKKLILLSILLIFFSGCDDESNPLNDILGTNITAKEKVADVKIEARANFASDAQLTGIFGRNVSSDGKVNLVDFSSVKGFIYMMQSESLEENEFYMPVIASDPVKLPFNLNDLLSFVQDLETKERLGGVFGLLSTVAISESASYPDSDEAMVKFLNGGGQAYLSANSGAKIDLFLVPSKSITINGIENSADWICNFYGGSTSLTLWLNSGTGIVTTF
ncbi:MAG: hypothetical protein SCALA702_12400 [Melioribacteraceae bacterium]|nr:MAG: hypothetical protein SCALA702_12400 [Melioribacteraceae bacterium]